MRTLLAVIFISLLRHASAQNTIEWTDNYVLQLSDYRSAASQIGASVITLHSATSIDFSFAMSNAEFMFTKNFNPKVTCSFNRLAASLVAPDSITANNLLDFGRYEFDMSELYARKLRKKLYEEKGTFSNVSFFKPIYDKVHEEYSIRHASAAKETDLGRNKEAMKKLHEEVLQEIQLLTDFCKACKPPKKKK